jgi:hypothetical protein
MREGALIRTNTVRGGPLFVWVGHRQFWKKRKKDGQQCLGAGHRQLLKKKKDGQSCNDFFTEMSAHVLHVYMILAEFLPSKNTR